MSSLSRLLPEEQRLQLPVHDPFRAPCDRACDREGVFPVVLPVQSAFKHAPHRSAQAEPTADSWVGRPHGMTNVRTRSKVADSACAAATDLALDAAVSAAGSAAL